MGVLPDRPPDRDAVKPPELIVMPSLSAPIDEGPFFPHPPMAGWRLVGRIALILGFGVLGAAIFLTRGSLFR